MSDTASVLFVNQAFYDAFTARDVEAMAALWSERTPVTCVHPGWRPLAGRDAVMQSWTAIMTNPASPRISCHSPAAFVIGTVAYVLCYEAIDDTFLVATNVFIREGANWRLVHHQAGAAPRPPSATTEDSEPTLQ